MARAVELGRRGLGRVEPNPAVGAVLVRDGAVVGEGWHAVFGGPHAEVEAIRAAGDRARGATLYVTLEPCCHWGKTPPCTDAVLAAGIREVVYGAVDPNLEVAGKGAAILAAAGLAVRRVEDDRACRELLAPYLAWRARGTPWVLAKWAMTLDGRIATRTGDSRWVSSEASRRRVHELRNLISAVAIGIGTALADDPLLTCRIEGGRQPLRVVVDTAARLPPEARLVRTAREVPVLVAVGPTAPAARVGALEAAGVEVLTLPAGAGSGVALNALLAVLAARGRSTLLVEGGSRLLGSLFDRRLVDEVEVYVAPIVVGGAGAPGPVGGEGVERIAQAVRLESVRIESIGTDVLVRGRPHLG